AAVVSPSTSAGGESTPLKRPPSSPATSRSTLGPPSGTLPEFVTPAVSGTANWPPSLAAGAPAVSLTWSSDLAGGACGVGEGDACALGLGVAAGFDDTLGFGVGTGVGVGVGGGGSGVGSADGD